LPPVCACGQLIRAGWPPSGSLDHSGSGKPPEQQRGRSGHVPGAASHRLTRPQPSVIGALMGGQGRPAGCRTQQRAAVCRNSGAQRHSDHTWEKQTRRFSPPPDGHGRGWLGLAWPHSNAAQPMAPPPVTDKSPQPAIRDHSTSCFDRLRRVCCVQQLPLPQFKAAQVPTVPLFVVHRFRVNDGDVKRAFITTRTRFATKPQSNAPEGSPSCLGDHAIFRHGFAPAPGAGRALNSRRTPPKRPNLSSPTLLSWVVPPLISPLVLQVSSPRRRWRRRSPGGVEGFHQIQGPGFHVPDEESARPFADCGRCG